jgi:hypothetical protein
MADDTFFNDVELDLPPIGQPAPSPYGRLIRPGEVPRDEEITQHMREVPLEDLTPVKPPAPPREKTDVEKITQSEPYRALTPRAMSERIGASPLPSEQEDVDTVNLREELAKRAARAKIEEATRGKGEIFQKPAVQEALSAAHAFGNVPFGAVDWGTAWTIKSLGNAGVKGYERFADMPIRQIYNESKELGGAFETESPKAALAGTAAGIPAFAYMSPAIAPEALGAITSGGLTSAVYSGMGTYLDTGDIGDAFKAAGLGAVLGSAAGPILEKVTSGFDKLQKTGRSLVTENSLSPEAVKIARQAGLSDADIEAITPHLLKTTVSYGNTPAAVRAAQFEEFGLPKTEGMVTQDARTLAREQSGKAAPVYSEIKAATEEAGAPMAKARAIEAGGPPMEGARAGDIAGTVKSAAEAAQEAGAAAKTAYEAQYEKAAATPGSFDKDVLDNVGDKLLANWASKENRIGFRQNNLAQEAADELNTKLGQYLDVPGGRVLWRNFRAVEEGRKAITGKFADAVTNTDRAALRQMVDDYDQYIEDSIRKGAFSGDPAVIQEWQKARKMFGDYQNKYGIKKTGEDAGRVVEDIVSGKKTPEDVANMIFNYNSSDANLRRNAAKVYMNLARTLGPNAPEMVAIKQSYIEKLMQPASRRADGSVRPADFQKVSKNINDFLNGKDRAFARAALTPAEKATLNRYKMVMDIAGKVPEKKTSEALLRMGSHAVNFGMNAATIAAGSAFGLNHPGLSTALGVGAALAAEVAPYVKNKFTAITPSTGMTGKYPSIRTGIGLGIPQVPKVVEDVENIDRQGRKAGGRVSFDAQADKLIRNAEFAKKNIGKQTENILKAPDEHVVQALKVANENLEG